MRFRFVGLTQVKAAAGPAKLQFGKVLIQFARGPVSDGCFLPIAHRLQLDGGLFKLLPSSEVGRCQSDAVHRAKWRALPQITCNSAEDGLYTRPSSTV